MVSADVEKLERLALHIDEFAKAVMQTAMNWAVTLIVVGMIAAVEDQIMIQQQLLQMSQINQLKRQIWNRRLCNRLWNFAFYGL